MFAVEVEIQFNMVIGASLETKQKDESLVIILSHSRSEFLLSLDHYSPFQQGCHCDF